MAFLKPTIPISLDYEDFECLVRGGILTIKHNKAKVKIALKDIGYFMMDRAIYMAREEEVDIYKGREKSP